MDIYQSKDIAGDKLPAVILIHGEGPEFFIKDAKELNFYTSYGRLLSVNGFVGIAFNHRPAGILSGFRNIKAASEDILDLIIYVKENAISGALMRIGYTFGDSLPEQSISACS